MDACCFEHLDTVREVVRVVEGIDPKEFLVSKREAGILEPHEGDVIDEGEVAGEPFTGLLQPRGGDRVQHNSNLDPLSLVLQPKDAKHGVVECTRGLHDVIVDIIDCRVDRYTSPKVRMPDLGPGQNLTAGLEGTSFRAPGPHRAVNPRAAEKAYILVVDDDPDVRWITSDTSEDLREIGYLVTEADSGRAALAILERGDPCDLMIADLVMTGLTGVDTVRLARRTRPDLKVLFCSGYADMSRFEKDIGNETLLRKPFGPDTLAEAVHSALQRAAQGAVDNVVQLRTALK